MTRSLSASANRKVSASLKSRLETLDSSRQIRALVLLRTGSGGRSSARRQNAEERKAAVEKMRHSAEKALADIDGVLSKHGGRRLAKGPSALGTIPVKTTKAGIVALASCRSVKGIFEDQEIHLIR